MRGTGEVFGVVGLWEVTILRWDCYSEVIVGDGDDEWGSFEGSVVV